MLAFIISNTADRLTFLKGSLEKKETLIILNTKGCWTTGSWNFIPWR